MTEPHKHSLLAAAPISRSDVLDRGRNGLPAPPVSPECYLQDSNGARDDEHTALPALPALSELSLQPTSPTSPSQRSRLTQETTYNLNRRHLRQTQHKREEDRRKVR